MSNDRAVTERDLRAPDFISGSPEDYEFRDDGKIVRKDRWENGIRRIASTFDVSGGFEIDDLVRWVRDLVSAREAAREINFCLLIDELIRSWQPREDDTPEIRFRRINARSALEAAIGKLLASTAADLPTGEPLQEAKE
jgi:hypothetical protein